ncbi:MAG: dipeptidase [Gemmatimonadota bacterium]|nr:dipeptidase [Gemmatimonadota bacterium]
MSTLSKYLQEQGEAFEQELREFLRIPSVSTESRYAKDVRHCAEWLAERIERIGVESVEVISTDGNPFVVAEHVVNPDLPTLLVYGHYDVQPVDPEELWTTPPFEPTMRDGRLYARGANDDKGQVHMHIKALEARLRTGVGMPVNVKFVFEGEEEIGSTHLEGFLREHSRRLACDAVVISDTGMLGLDIPSIGTGLRGLAYLEVFVDGPAGDLHSGSYGGAVVNPALALAGMLSRLRDDEGRVTVPGFYDRVRPMTDAERAAVRDLPFDEEEFRAETGAPALDGEAGFSTLERLWYRPTLDVNGMISGFTGEGAKTVLPATARAKVSMRLVPDQDPDEIADLFARHVRSLAPRGVHVRVERSHGGRPWAADPDSPLFEAAAAALEDSFGRAPVYVREGGSIPIVPLFEEIFDGPVLLLGFAPPGGNAHAPNEWMDMSVYHKGIETIARLYDRVSRQGI